MSRADDSSTSCCHQYADAFHACAADELADIAAHGGRNLDSGGSIAPDAAIL